MSFDFKKMRECQTLDPPQWVTKYGRCIPIVELQQSHLENIVVFLDKKLINMPTREDMRALYAARRLESAFVFQDDGLDFAEDEWIETQLDKLDDVVKTWSAWVPIINAEIERRKSCDQSPS